MTAEGFPGRPLHGRLRPMPFTPQTTSVKSRARRGVLHTPHGDLPTPFFVPIATRGGR